MSARSSFSSRIRPIVLALSLLSAQVAFADSVTDQAKAMIEHGQSQAAYDLLSPLESARAGEETYDLLLGIAAADIGRSTNAVLALERVLAVNPNNARARAEIARAYFALGEVKTAREEFDTVKKQGVPPEVEKTIEKFLSAVDRVEDEGHTTFKSYVEASIGWDSNVNAATSDSAIAIPNFIAIPLTGANAKQSDDYAGVAAGVNVRMPIDARLALVAGVVGSKRMNNTWDIFDTGSLDGNVGLTYKDDKDVYSAAVQGGTYFVDNVRYRDSVGLSAQWQHNYDQRMQATVFAQYADLRYGPGADDFNGANRDADRLLVGLGFARATRDFKTVFYGSAYAGYEDARNQPTKALDFRMYGLRAGAQYQFREDLSFFINGSYEKRDHQADYGAWGVYRNDDNYNAGLGAIWIPAKTWTVTPQYQRADNRSNISYFSYARDVVSITVRKDF